MVQANKQSESVRVFKFLKSSHIMNLFHLNTLEVKRVVGTIGSHFEIKKCLYATVSLILMYFFLGDLLLLLMVQESSGKMPLSPNNSTAVPCHPQPYCHLDMKSLLLDLPNFYIHHPLSAIIYDWTKFGTHFSFISANAISIFHVFLAMLSAKCIANESLCVRRIGVAFFALRNFLDAFDGTVARARRKNVPGYSNVGSTGYWVDGLADAFGTTFLLFGCLAYILRHPLRGKQYNSYTPLPVMITTTGDEAHWDDENAKPPQAQQRCGLKSGLQPVILGIQAIVSSICWNRYIALYTKLLENTSVPEEARVFQGRVVKSFRMWIVIILWRLCNVHSMLELLLAAIFFDKMVEFMTFVQFLGFIPLAVSVLMAEVHLNDVQLYLADSYAALHASSVSPMVPHLSSTPSH